MEIARATTDQLEQRLAAAEEVVSQARAVQLQILEELDRRQVATADGSRSLSEWLAARIDLGPKTSKSLVRTMRRTADQPELRRELASSVSFDRVEALSRLQDRENDDLLLWTDVAGVHREAAKQARVTAEAESRTADDRFLVVQPTLDESWWKVWAGFDGYTGALFDKLVSEAADALPDDVEGDARWRRATGLIESLISDNPPESQVTVIVDAKDAAPTDGEAGVTLDSGVRVGRRALGAILCDANVEVTARAANGTFMDYGRRERTAPPALKRALLAEAGFTCAGDGCNSRHRLQIHHLTPWAEGGRTDQDELVVLCWFHHHVAVHEREFQVVLHPDRRRVRFRRPEGRAPPG
ncbi:MAG TPA: HNH endonuclease signature motif containing protein [Acidimicrobiia bacterium]